MRDEAPFEWSADVEEVLFHTLPGVAVYLNPMGNIVIRNEADGYIRTEDPFVVVPLMAVPKLIDRLKALLAEGLDGSV